MLEHINIRKADGTTEAFQMSKLRTSLKRAGASETEMTQITRTIESELVEGMTTEQIYRHAFDLLRQGEKTTAARYSLRRAMIGLGPTGFPFEDYLAALFTAQGYKTRTRAIVKGKCVSHEVDVVAYKDSDCFVAEAKFHMQPGIKSDLQVILYSHARFLDIVGVKVHKNDIATITKPWVITNTKFTSTAIQYAKCAGVHLLSWDYPKKDNLQQMIETTKLYPITVLQSLSLRDKKTLLSQGTVLCSDVIDNQQLLSSAGVPRNKMSAILDESVRLCTIN